jgi:hypothetical protein
MGGKCDTKEWGKNQMLNLFSPPVHGSAAFVTQQKPQ